MAINRGPYLALFQAFIDLTNDLFFGFTFRSYFLEEFRIECHSMLASFEIHLYSQR